MLGESLLPESPYNCLALEGGGAKGVLYPGVATELERMGIFQQFDAVGGSSVGALSAICFATGWSAKKITEKFDSLDLSELAIGGVLDKLTIPLTLHNHYALFNPKNIRKWLGEILHEVSGKKNITFKQWHELKEARPELSLKDIFLTATNLNTGMVEIFSHLSSHKDVPIRDGGRASGAFPFVLAPFEINGCLYGDGGMQLNCPSSIFEMSPGTYNPRVLSVRLDNASEIAFYEQGVLPTPKKLDNLFKVWAANIEALLKVQNATYNQSPYASHTIFGDTLDGGTLEFGMADEKRKMLFASGQYSTIRYMHKNHPELTRGIYHPKLLAQIEENNFERSFAAFVNFHVDLKAENKHRKQSDSRSIPKEKEVGEKPYKEWRKFCFEHFKAANIGHHPVSSSSYAASSSSSYEHKKKPHF